jgi:hypothetical protein
MIVAACILKLKEALLILKVYGHTFLCFIGYGVYLEISGIPGFETEISINNSRISHELSAFIFSLVTLIFIYSLFCKSTTEYFHKQITPNSISKYYNGNITACYMAFIALFISIQDSNVVKQRNNNIDNFLSSAYINSTIILFHYNKKPIEFNDIAINLVNADIKEMSELPYISTESQELIDKTTVKISSIKNYIEKEHNKNRQQEAADAAPLL